MTSQPMQANILFVAGHTGSANYLVPVLSRLPAPWRAFVHADAAEVFSRNGLPCTVVDAVEWSDLETMGQSIVGSGTYSAVVTGTSPKPTVDRAVVGAARRSGIPSASIVEHWSFYRERFCRVEAAGAAFADLTLPDQIWLNDPVAMADAVAAGLPASGMLVMGQPHLERQRDILGQCTQARRAKTVVLFSEMLAEDFVRASPMDLGFDEFEVIDDVVEALPRDAELTIKLHPEEAPDKYDYLAARGVRA